MEVLNAGELFEGRYRVEGVLGEGGIAVNSHRCTTLESKCEDQRAVPVLHMAPLGTARLPVEGGVSCRGHDLPSLEAVEVFWRTQNQCGAEAHEQRYDGKSACYDWECATPFRSCHLDGGVGWPGTAPRQLAKPRDMECDGVPADFPAAQVALEFFASVGADGP